MSHSLVLEKGYTNNSGWKKRSLKWWIWWIKMSRRQGSSIELQLFLSSWKQYLCLWSQKTFPPQNPDARVEWYISLHKSSGFPSPIFLPRQYWTSLKKIYWNTSWKMFNSLPQKQLFISPKSNEKGLSLQIIYIYFITFVLSLL